MDSKHTMIPTRLLDAARIIPIAELSPDHADPSTQAIGGVVTITWPYNKVKGTFAFTLAEPDFRLRRNKGQVRIDFTGRAAKAVGDSGLGGNDEVLLSLEGATWEAEAIDRRRSLPGADIGWKLVFSERVSLKIKRAETNETDIVIVDDRASEREPTSDLKPPEPIDITKSPSPLAPLSPMDRTTPTREVKTTKPNDNEFASPAFVRRARISYGALFEDGFDIFRDDGGVEGKGRKRTRFGRHSSSWRYASRSASPEPAAASPESVGEQVSSPTKAAGLPSKAQMADEGCQTMELDESSPQPISTAPEAEMHGMLPNAPMDNASIETPMDSTKDRKTQMPPLNDWLSEPGDQSISAPKSNDISLANSDAPLPHPGQPFSSSGYNFAENSWNMSVPPPAFEPQQTGLSPVLHEPFGSSGFGNAASSIPPTPLGGSHDLNITYPDTSETQEPVDDGMAHSIEPSPPGTNYLHLEPDDDTHRKLIHDEAITNYPASYLEGGHISQHGLMIAEELSEYPGVPKLGSSSWATVNQTSRATATAPTDRLGSGDGDTPEQAVVIDESDANSDSGPEPMAVEDTVNNGRAYALSMYQDAEAEDEVDAQYSDDDEPEYDADEMGGDYDTRNYEQPGDDDEGSPDQIRRPQSLEPEFDDGESCDEEEAEQEELLDEEDEGGYETDVDINGNVSHSAVRANPTVIDLVSSSEDEFEDENEDEGGDTMTEVEQSGAHIDSRTLPSNQQMVQQDDPEQVLLRDEESDIISQVSISEADDYSEADEERHEYMNSHEEREEEYEGEAEDNGLDNDEAIPKAVRLEREPGSHDEGNIWKPESRYQAEQQMEPEIKSETKEERTDNAVLGIAHSHADVSCRQTPPITEVNESIGAATSKGSPKEESSMPLSAADGLEMLSRAVDKESSAYSHNTPTKPVETRLAEQSTAEPPGGDNIQLQDSPSYQPNTNLGVDINELPARDDEEASVDPIASSKSHTRSPSVNIDKNEPTVAAPSSPPFTHSFRSLIEDNNGTLEETTVKMTAELATTQLPTPHNTQPTDIALNISTPASINIAESFESHMTIKQQDYQPYEGPLAENLVENLTQQDSEMNLDQENIVQDHDDEPIPDYHAQQFLGDSSATSSPPHSFETQVAEKDPVLPGSVEKTKNDSQYPQRFSSESSSSASDTNKSFASHMEIDEELQASILEDSRIEDYFDLSDRDENNEISQDNTSEAYVEPEESSQAKSTSSLYENTPARQLAEDISAQLKRNFMADSSGEESDTSTRNDPSLHLARAANASRKAKRKRAASSDSYRPRKRLFDTRRSRTPETDDSSMYLTRASLASQTPRSEEDSYSMTAAKLQLARHLRDELLDCTSLKGLRQHLTKSLDVIAVAVMQPPEPQRAKGRPREYMMSFTIADHSIGPYAVAEALIYRPHKDSLPQVRYGDIVLLRNFTVVALANKGFGLRTNNRSSWAVFDYEGEPPQIKGPPVEYSEKETLYVDYLREWFRLLDVKARQKLELANQKIINTGKSN
ncbi:hypothetical protein F4678DRAFT_411752 [Xylaria arbuscula]|nr:hypothetical protein F4678DRAFT_411752 [Xylaria arbuscula]